MKRLIFTASLCCLSIYSYCQDITPPFLIRNRTAPFNEIHTFCVNNGFSYHGAAKENYVSWQKTTQKDYQITSQILLLKQGATIDENIIIYATSSKKSYDDALKNAEWYSFKKYNEDIKEGESNEYYYSESYNITLIRAIGYEKAIGTIYKFSVFSGKK